MILSESHELQLQKTYDKVLYLYPAYNQTYAFLARRAAGKEVFVHCSRHGKILYELVLDDPTYSLALVSDHEAIILLTRKNSILIIELENYSSQSLPFCFLFEQSDQSAIHTFNISRTFCIQEKGLYGDNRLKLSYYSYPLSQASKPIVVYESGEQQWSFDYLVKKGNEKNLILWWKPRQEKQIQLRGFRLADEGTKIRGEYVIFEAEYDEFGNKLKLQYVISKSWELQSDRFIILCLMFNKDSMKIEEENQGQLVLQNKKRVLRCLNFKQPKEYKEFQVDQMNIGVFSMLRTYSFKNAQTLSTPIYYLNNFTQELISEENWQCSHLFKYFISGYQKDVLIECQYDNADVNDIIVTKKKLINSQIIGLHLLLEMHEEFDEDLLHEAIDFLPPYGKDSE